MSTSTPLKSVAEKYPALAVRWDSKLNPFQLEDVESIKWAGKYYWKCNNNLPHSFFSSADQIRSRGTNCSVCSGHQVLSGVNDLATLANTKVLAEWDHVENAKLGIYPTQVTLNSGRKVNWLCAKYKHSFTQVIAARTGPRETGCPFCSGHKVREGFNDLAFRFPDIAEEWDYEQNIGFTPNQVAWGSNKKISWVCKKANHHFAQAIASRTSKDKCGCPYCSGRLSKKGETDLATKGSQEVLAEWDYVENAKLGLYPDQVSYGSSKKAWWSCKKTNHPSFSQAISGRTRSNKTGCSICANKKILAGDNDLASLWSSKLSAEWDHVENGKLGLYPDQLSCGSGKKVHWLCTKKKHAFKQVISARTGLKAYGCPYCSGRLPTEGEDDLASLWSSKLSAEWDHVENAKLGLYPNQVTLGSSKKAWWLCAKKKHAFEQVIAARTGLRAAGCSVCSGHKTLSGVNDLKTLCDPKIFAEWNDERNSKLGIDPTLIAHSSAKLAWWVCSKGSHDFSQKISSRTSSSKTSCPVCSGHKVQEGVNDIAFRFPDIAAEWDYKKNIGLRPTQVSFGSGKKVWWLCKKSNHSFKQVVSSRTSKDKCGCPYCFNRIPTEGENDLASLWSSKLSAEWDHVENAKLGLYPNRFTFGSSKKAWWLCANPNHPSFSQVISDRTGPDKTGCPFCSNKKVVAGDNDLASLWSPKLSAEWDHVENAKLGLYPNQVTFGSSKKAWWLCEKANHSFRQYIYARTGSQKQCCPKCFNARSSRVELRFFEEIQLKFPDAKNGSRLPFSFTDKRKSMSIDILFNANDKKAVVEYDGAYYHDGRRSGKGLPWHLEHDGMKTEALLAAGFTVVRIRGDQLPHLQLSDPNLFQISHAEVKGNISATVAAILVFLNGLPVS